MTRDCKESRRDPKQRPCFGCGQIGHVKAQCPKNANKPVNTAVVHFGRVEVAKKEDVVKRPGDPVTTLSSAQWTTPRKTARPKPTPKTATLGDFLGGSVFTKLQVSEKMEPEHTDDEDEHWIDDFELKYADMERVPKKEKHQKVPCKPSSSKKGTPAAESFGRSRGDKSVTSFDAECRVMEVVYPEGAEILAADAVMPRYTTLKVALDSGAGAHVINKADAPGCKISPSAMSRAGAAFIAADGGKIANYGEVMVSMIAVDSTGEQHQISSRFEAADVTRALWSVGLICDSGLGVQFSSDKAIVSDKAGNEICVFHRSNGLYVAEVQVENPMGESFHRPGK